MNKMNEQRDSERIDTSHIPDAVKQQIIKDADDAAYIRWLNQRDEQMKLHPELY
jgi:hypothetical protein